MTDRPSTTLLHLTPHLLARIEALGFVPGSEGALPWLVALAEELRRTEAAAGLRHEAALVRLSTIREALLDATGSAPAITDPPDVWSRAIRAVVEGRS